MPACEDGSHYTVVHGDNGEITYEVSDLRFGHTASGIAAAAKFIQSVSS